MAPISLFFEMVLYSVVVGILFLGVVFLPALVGLIAAILAARQEPDSVKRKWKWLLMPFSITVLILIYGVVFHYGGPPGSAPALRGAGLKLLMWSHVPAATMLIILFRKNSIIPIGFSGFQVWLSYSAFVVSFWSVTNTGWF